MAITCTTASTKNTRTMKGHDVSPSHSCSRPLSSPSCSSQSRSSPSRSRSPLPTLPSSSSPLSDHPQQQQQQQQQQLLAGSPARHRSPRGSPGDNSKQQGTTTTSPSTNSTTSSSSPAHPHNHNYAVNNNNNSCRRRIFLVCRRHCRHVALALFPILLLSQYRLMSVAVLQTLSPPDEQMFPFLPSNSNSNSMTTTTSKMTTTIDNQRHRSQQQQQQQEHDNLHVQAERKRRSRLDERTMERDRRGMQVAAAAATGQQSLQQQQQQQQDDQNQPAALSYSAKDDPNTEMTPGRVANPLAPPLALAPPPPAHVMEALKEFDPAVYPILPPQLHTPKANRPVQVIFIGTQESVVTSATYRRKHASDIYAQYPAGKDGSTFLINGLEQSKYVQVIMTAVYDPFLFTTRVDVRHTSKDGALLSQQQPQQPVLFVVDWGALYRDCHALERILASQALNTTMDALRTNTLLRQRSQIVLVDMTRSTRTITCSNYQQQNQQDQNQNYHHQLEQVFSKSRTRLVKTSIVEGRFWNHSAGWIEPGQIIANVGRETSAGPVLHLPLFLRDSYVTQLQAVASRLYSNIAAAVGSSNSKAGGSSTSSSRYFMSSDLIDTIVRSKKRKTSVAHFWRKGDNAHFNMLRNRVSQELLQLSGRELVHFSSNTNDNIINNYNSSSDLLHGENKNNNSSSSSSGSQDRDDKVDTIQVLVRMVGDHDAIERNCSVEAHYVEQMLRSKIVVVAQHDEWEDHYRLLESLASGALVLTDRMLAPPPALAPYLQDGVNIVVYDSPQALRSLILYYLDDANKAQRLAIAQRGMQLAWHHLRSWHAVETILFGSILTK